jgi:glycerophosphoryl diester phosphodiesterase
MQAEGRRAFVWTLDVDRYISTFVTEGEFDGILTNYPTLVAYYHYVR